MRKVVTNSTPLISLYKIGKIDILQRLYGEIYIPYGVYEELSVDDKYNFLLELDFIMIEKIKNEEAKRLFTTTLHKGEVEVMILAGEIQADLCIIDDLLARKYARYLDLKITGTLGVLLKAKEKGYIEYIKPLLNELIKNDIYIGNSLYSKVLEMAHE